MNCSLSAPITFSIEVEPLVDTVPLRAAGVETGACAEAAGAAGATEDEPLPPQPASSAAVIPRARNKLIAFFISMISF